ncbi:formate dehydrogenase accessory protein FdhE [Bacillus dakarensis]|uniref:formate dehydrogenase accessory protein FdhE n=1 Tax=Robertmurraya dakarensis TaxID=1926278 RepID=UPI000980EBB1|nr:formate dehydrogenase accessory protein FdhE [Bacillus dakarensis]
MSVLNKQYLEQEEQIQALSEKWRDTLENQTLTNEEEYSKVDVFPIIPQIQLQVDLSDYQGFILELFTLLEENQPGLAGDIAKLKEVLTMDVLGQWFQEGIAVNHLFFEEFAKNANVKDWLPMFAAEHGVRPFLQKAAAELNEILKEAKAHHGCPACGEPSRLAVISKTGKKEITCPRCSYSWEEKKISCAHCGCEEPGKIEILRVEKDDRAEVHVCHECKGYTKVIDTRKLIRKDAPQLLDSKFIHLDYIAQEHGYGVSEGKDVH